jgi:hypothetical protein
MARPRRVGAPPHEAPTTTGQELDPTPTEEERRLEFVFRLLARGCSDSLVRRIARQELGTGTVATTRLIGLVRERLRVDVEGRRPYARAEQIARLRDTIEKLKTPRFRTAKRRERGEDGRVREREVQEEVPLPAQNIMRAEELLADLEGNRVPIKVEVEHTLGLAARAVFANLTPERMEALLERARERKRLALAASGVVEMPR